MVTHECTEEARITRTEKDIQNLWGVDGIRGLREEISAVYKLRIAHLSATVIALIGIVAIFIQGTGGR